MHLEPVSDLPGRAPHLEAVPNVLDCVVGDAPVDLLVDLPEQGESDFFIDSLLVRIHRCFWWTVLAPWEFEFPFPGSLISTFLEEHGTFNTSCVFSGRLVL